MDRQPQPSGWLPADQHSWEASRPAAARRMHPWGLLVVPPQAEPDAGWWVSAPETARGPPVTPALMPEHCSTSGGGRFRQHPAGSQTRDPAWRAQAAPLYLL